MERNGYFLIILGDVGRSYNLIMKKRVTELGEARQILENTYILKVGDAENQNKESIRDYLAGKEFGYCIVIDMEKFVSAWSLTQKDSDYLKTIFQQD